MHWISIIWSRAFWTNQFRISSCFFLGRFKSPFILSMFLSILLGKLFKDFDNLIFSLVWPMFSLHFFLNVLLKFYQTLFLANTWRANNWVLNLRVHFLIINFLLQTVYICMIFLFLVSIWILRILLLRFIKYILFVDINILLRIFIISPHYQ